MRIQLSQLHWGWLLTTIVGLVGCDMSVNHMYSAADKSRAYPTNGEQIYFTGRNQAGYLIAYQGGNMHAQMHVTACADCHGVLREGGRRMYPTFWLKAPSLTTEALFGDHSDGHGDHAAYTRESLKRVITYGVDPSGEQLDSTMPRWLMSEPDLEDLVDYLAGGTMESEEHEH
ncbi:c-type cytochrome [Photobacterium sp.]|uniref:c-type cytochrome n=1 Tax=Photobacterium sp. TaxID=660 RepID=UPI00299DFC96|nr:c-type cytochrome [Photobacterium sp.]MDX1302896.1 c-type cytochrome [Photobacterium sp.]